MFGLPHRALSRESSAQQGITSDSPDSRTSRIGSHAPSCPQFRPPRIRCEGLRHEFSYVRSLCGRQPIPPQKQRNDVASEAVNGSEPTVLGAVKVLCPEWTLFRLL